MVNAHRALLGFSESYWLHFFAIDVYSSAHQPSVTSITPVKPVTPVTPVTPGVYASAHQPSALLIATPISHLPLQHLHPLHLPIATPISHRTLASLLLACSQPRLTPSTGMLTAALDPRSAGLETHRAVHQELGQARREARARSQGGGRSELIARISDATNWRAGSSADASRTDIVLISH